MTFHSDSDFLAAPRDWGFDTLGFEREAVMALLGVAGEASSHASKWGESLPLVKWFTVNDAAAIFAGYHPRELEHCNYDEEPYEVADARQMFCQAADAGEIECDKDGNQGSIQIQWNHTLNHGSIREWCAARGKKWPLSAHTNSLHASTYEGDASLTNALQRLAEAEAESTRLAALLETVTSERDSLHEQNKAQSAELEEAVKGKVAAIAETARLKEQFDDKEKVLSTQGRNSALVIMAALAKEAKYDISLPSRSGEILASVTSTLGCPMTGRAISGWFTDIPEALKTRAK